MLIHGGKSKRAGGRGAGESCEVHGFSIGRRSQIIHLYRGGGVERDACAITGNIVAAAVGEVAPGGKAGRAQRWHVVVEPAYLDPAIDFGRTEAEVGIIGLLHLGKAGGREQHRVDERQKCE